MPKRSFAGKKFRISIMAEKNLPPCVAVAEDLALSNDYKLNTPTLDILIMLVFKALSYALSADYLPLSGHFPDRMAQKYKIVLKYPPR